MGDSSEAKPTLLRTLSSNVGPDRNRFHHRDLSGCGLPRYDKVTPLKDRKVSAAVPDNGVLLRALPRLSELSETSATTVLIDGDDDVDHRNVNSQLAVEEGGQQKTSCVSKAWTIYKLVFVTLSLVIAIFDLGADWYAVEDFHKNEGGKLAIALTVFISISTVLFLMEAVNGVTSIQVYGFGRGDRNAVEVRREALSYGLLLMEDLPVTIIMFLTFRTAPCSLYTRIFNDSLVAKLSILAAFVSSLWKGLISFKYFIQCLCGEKFDVKDPKQVKRRPSKRSRDEKLSWDDRVFCWACVRCRPMRMIINIVVSAFAGYVFIRVWSNDPYILRPDCTPANYTKAMQLSQMLNQISTTDVMTL